MNLFQFSKTTLHSGKVSNFKIECDTLTDGDWDTLAYLGKSIVGDFSMVYGIPTGGKRFAEAMEKYSTGKGPCLIVDDVLTTGGNMLEVLEEECVGLVAFARGPCPPGVKAIFYMNEEAEDVE